MAKVLKYRFLSCEVNHGTEEEPNIEQIILDKRMPWSETNEAIVKQEAYNGEYTVEDNGEPDPEVPTNDDSAVWDELDKAYEEGFGEGYKEGVDNVYDE